MSPTRAWSMPGCVAWLSAQTALAPGNILMAGSAQRLDAALAGDLLRGAGPGPGAIELRVPR